MIVFAAPLCNAASTGLCCAVKCMFVFFAAAVVEEATNLKSVAVAMAGKRATSTVRADKGKAPKKEPKSKPKAKANVAAVAKAESESEKKGSTDCVAISKQD